MVENGFSDFVNYKVDSYSMSILLFTSGTTAKSKAVMLNQYGIVTNIYDMQLVEPFFETDTNIAFLPFHHIFGLTGMLVMLASGVKTVFPDGLRYIKQNLIEYKVSLFVGVPILIEKMYETIIKELEKQKKLGLINFAIRLSNLLLKLHIDVRRKLFKPLIDQLGSEMRFIISGGAPLDKKVAKFFNSIGIHLVQGYGLTETAPIAALTPEYEPSRYASTGMAVKDTDIKLKNVNDAGEGEILIKGPTVMLGYYEDEEATNEVMEDGYFCTGDIGRIDSDGFIYITGRSKNVIVTQNGKNIYPEEIELMLGEIPEISECMVYGKKESEDAHDKELIITAKIIPNYTKIEELHGKNLSDDEIYKIIWDKVKENNKKLTSYKAVKKIEIKKDEFEKTTTMKIKRFAEINKDKAIK